MARYIALLRGINISGKNKISMPELKTALGEKGFADVKTYLNSGNVIFSDDETDAAKLEKVEICGNPAFFYSTTALASISTSAPFGNAATSKQLRAGFETKYFS